MRGIVREVEKEGMVLCADEFDGFEIKPVGEVFVRQAHLDVGHEFVGMPIVAGTDVALLGTEDFVEAVLLRRPR